MKNIVKSLAITVLAVASLLSMVTSVDAAAWVGHKFMFQLPDGKTKELKGAKLHIYHRQHEDKGGDAFHNTCYYPEKETASNEWEREVRDEIGDDAFCATPSSCSIIDYGAPYLPADFNDDRDIHPGGGIYERDNASYKAFYGKTFSEALSEDAPFAYLANRYQKGNIRGFEGAKWQGSVTYSLEEDDDGERQKVGLASASEIAVLDANQFWGNNIRYIDGKQKWEEGEVFRDPLGGNVLHAQITWVLKAPAAPPSEKPTGSLAGRCANDSPGVPSYRYTLSNIDLKGGTFKSSHLHLNVTKGSIGEEFKSVFGPPIYENASVISYSLIFTTTAPINNTITWDVLPTEGIGNQPSNTKTVADLVAWVDAKKAGGVTVPFEIKTTLEYEKDGITVLNDSITVGSGGFRPQFVTDECGQTGGGGDTIPACVSLRLLDSSNSPITNPNAIQPGALVKLECGNVTGVNGYAFRMISFDANGNPIGNPLIIQPESTGSNRSRAINIPNEGGRFTAQCAICASGSTSCEFGEAPTTPPTTPPDAPVACPFSCVAPSGCIDVAEGNFACPVSGQVCCENRTRDE